LLEPQVGGRVNRSKDRELKDGIGEAEKDKNEPESLETKNASQAVAQGNPDGISQEHDHITNEDPEYGIEGWSDGVLA
jgi:hypothetical protein